MPLKNLSLSIRSNSNAESNGIITVDWYSAKKRILYVFSLAIGGLTLTAAVVFIPLLHFILVPLCSLSTVLVTILAAKKLKAVIISGEGKCPCCNKTISIGWRLFSEKFTQRCFSCQRTVTVQVLIATGDDL